MMASGTLSQESLYGCTFEKGRLESLWARRSDELSRQMTTIKASG